MHLSMFINQLASVEIFTIKNVSKKDKTFYYEKTVAKNFVYGTFLISSAQISVKISGTKAHINTDKRTTNNISFE